MHAAEWAAVGPVVTIALAPQFVEPTAARARTIRWFARVWQGFHTARYLETHDGAPEVFDEVTALFEAGVFNLPTPDALEFDELVGKVAASGNISILRQRWSVTF